MCKEGLIYICQMDRSIIWLRIIIIFVENCFIIFILFVSCLDNFTLLPQEFFFCSEHFPFAVRMFLHPWDFLFFCENFYFSVRIFILLWELFFAVRIFLLSWKFFIRCEHISFMWANLKKETYRAKRLW